MTEFVIKNVFPGKLNALVKNLMDQMGIIDPDEAVRRINSREWVVKRAKENSILNRLYAEEVIEVVGREMVVCELIKNATFKEMYGSFGVNLEHLWVTKLQRDEFCEKHRGMLRDDGSYSNFFLCKKDEAKRATPKNLEVDRVSVSSNGLRVGTIEIDYDGMWYLDDQPRLVIPRSATL